MGHCSPQRYLANNRNRILGATLTPSSVQPVTDQVLEVPVGRSGSAQVALTGTYTGVEQATYDVEILSDTVTVPRISAPVFSGAGSGSLANIAAVGLVAQEFTVSMLDAGIRALYAGVDMEGVHLRARTIGTTGNLLRIVIDQTPITHTPSTYSLLVDLAVGAGSDTNGLEGPEYDWDTKVLGADNLIPTSAHRVSFGDDHAAIYLQYKQYKDGKWTYHFVPEIKHVVAKGSRVNFVTGGRDVVVTDGTTPEATITNVVTLYDLLNGLTASTYIVVDGIISNDRSPTGQASHELLTRTDAYVQPSTGSGSAAATGFVGTFAGANANTELVTAECYAVSSKDHPLARLGAERWKLKGSVSGDLGDIVTNIPYVEPSTPAKFGLTIPSRLPVSYGVQRGRFTHRDTIYVPRPEGVENPPICIKPMTLGTEATDQTITLTYTKRPSGNCLCDKMPLQKLDPRCLGLIDTEGGSMDYSAAAITRLIALYDWGNTLAGLISKYVQGYEHDGIPETSVALSAQPFTGGQHLTLPNDNNEVTLGALPGLGTPPVGAVAAPTHAINVPLDDGLVASAYADEISAQAVDILDAYEAAIQVIDTQTDATLKAAGFTQWDAALAIMVADLDAAALTALAVDRVNSFAIEKYKIAARSAIAYAGLSPMGKSDASILDSGDGCWRDWGGDYWKVEGADGLYAPAFTNHRYYASRAATEGGKYFSTKEWGICINMKCPEKLMYGDQIILLIGGAGWGATYQTGDVLTLPVVAAQSLFLAGGQNASTVQTWAVSGSVVGPLANFAFDPGAPTTYSNGGLSFALLVGGIPYAKGDTWKFTLEGGVYQWRKNGGSWNGPFNVPAAPVALDSGLNIEFIAGAAPSFVALDTFSFIALQPWAVSNIFVPDLLRWQWTGATPTLLIDMGASGPVNDFAMALHTLPVGATVTIQGGVTAGVYTWTETLTRRAGVMVAEFTTPQTARYLLITLAAATGGGIGWIWVGDPLVTELSAELVLRDAYNVQRGSVGLFQGGLYLGSTVSGEVSWPEGMVSDTDRTAIRSLISYSKASNDQPIIVVPQIQRPEEAILVRIVSDEVEMDDITKYNANAGVERRFSAKLPLAGVWQ